ncbi:MAG: hypothetical protein ABIH38_03980 [Patescibacteria group bacterium]
MKLIKTQKGRKNWPKKIFIWVVIPLFLLIINIYLVRPLFHLEYTAEMGSIESVFLADGRFIIDHGLNASWNPGWYMGFPFRFFYPPLFHALVAYIAKIFSAVSVGLSYHFVTALFYCLGAVGLYYFIRYLTKKTFPAFIAGFLLTILPSFSYLIPAVKSAATNYHLAPWRLVVLLQYGEGPHIFALAILPFVLLVFLWALRKPSLKSYLAASLIVAVIPLTNWPSSISLLIMLFSLLVAEMFLGQAFFKLKRSLLILITAYGFSAFWLSFSYIYTTFAIAGPRGGGGFLQTYVNLLPWLLVVAPLLVGLLLAIFHKKQKRYTWSFAIFYAILFSIIIFSGYFSQVKIVPESNRFTPEWNMGLIVLSALLLNAVYQKINFSKIMLSAGVKTAMIIMIMAAAVYLGWPFIRNSGEIIKENKDITRSAEYEIAQWLTQNTNGERVYATGSIAFWLNVWTDVPQVRGGSDQGATNLWFNHATYQINTSENAPAGLEGFLAVSWLKAFNVSYLVFNMPSSREVFHDFKDPRKFEGILEEAYNKQGDIIYKIPLKNPSLAQVADQQELADLSPPLNAVDYQAIENYVGVVDEKAKPADFSWLSVREAEIKATLGPGEVISVQETYHDGWRAYASGQRVPIKKDVLGFMIIEPGIGNHTIKLKHGLTLDEYFGYFLTFMTFVLIVFFRFKKGKKWLYAQNKSNY